MGFAEAFHYYWVEQADPRSKDWLLVPNITPMAVIIFTYLYVVLSLGPRLMKNRQPYSLKNFVRVYNIFQIIANAWMVKCLIDAGWFTTITLYCEPVDYSDDPTAMRLLELMWWMIFIKVLDLVETCVFVMRKKQRQISFLHLYHHVSTLIMQWLGTKYVAGGMATFLTLVNSSVHVIMYTYYFLSTLGPTVQKAVSPFKPFITIIQIVQFWGLIIHMSQVYLPSCPAPALPAIIMSTNLMVNFVLFFNFYRKNYVKPARKKVN